MLEQTQPDTNIDAFAPTPKKNLKIWGQIDYKETLVGFTLPVKDEYGNTITKGSKDPYDPAIHKSPSLAIDLYIQPLPEVNIANSRILEYNVTKGSLQWEKETLPSLLKLGVTGKEQINQAWACIEIIESKKTYVTSSGETKPRLSWNFLKMFSDEDECRVDCLAVGGQPSNSQNVATSAPVTSESANMLNYMKVIIKQNVTEEMTLDEAKDVIASHQSYPALSKFYTVDSPEVLGLIGRVVIPF